MRKVKDTPTYCGCGKRNSVDHTLICPNGGYVIMRHNNLRDVNAEFQKEVCHDVKVEPMLIPIEGENTQIEGAKEDGAHPEVCGVPLRGHSMMCKLFTQTHHHTLTQRLSSCWCKKKR